MSHDTPDPRHWAECPNEIFGCAEICFSARHGAVRGALFANSILEDSHDERHSADLQCLAALH